MNDKMTNRKKAALEAAAKYICNIQDGRCPMVVEHYQCLSACGPDTQPWRCWIDHFLISAQAINAATARAGYSPDLSSRLSPENKHRGTHGPTADRDW